MKVKTISRTEEQCVRATTDDIYKVHRNTHPDLHPFERQREYMRTLNHVKLNRLFSKPFLHALTTPDAAYSIAKNYSDLTTLYSGCSDGSIQAWDLGTMTQKSSFQAHEGFVKGITAYDDIMISCGQDKTIKIWDKPGNELDQSTNPRQVYMSRQPLNFIDHHYHKPTFGTASSTIDIWDHSRSSPVYTMSWGAESITSVRFNATETNVLASCGTDRTIILYDLRTQTPLSKVIMALRTNAIAWNPMEAFNFTAANEDHNCYTFDMRNLSNTLSVAKDHVSAVLDIDYSPTGQEFVTGSYDRTVRIFSAREGRSREIYHTKRMQKVFGVKFSMDAKFVFSASDDGNVRVWKANAGEKMGMLSNRERAHLEYTSALKNRYQNLPEIRRIDKQRKVPKAIRSAGDKKKIMLDSRKRKEEQLRKHSAPGSVPFVAERKKHILTVEK